MTNEPVLNFIDQAIEKNRKAVNRFYGNLDACTWQNYQMTVKIKLTADQHPATNHRYKKANVTILTEVDGKSLINSYQKTIQQ